MASKIAKNVGVQKLVVLTYHDGAMRLFSGNTVRAQWTVAAMVTPLEAKAHFLTFGFLEPTALGTFVSSRTASSARGNANVEGLDAISAW